jgi:hypothetical protein
MSESILNEAAGLFVNQSRVTENDQIRFLDSDSSQSGHDDDPWRAKWSEAGWLSHKDYGLFRKTESWQSNVQKIASVGVKFGFVFFAIKLTLKYLFFSFSTESGLLSGANVINFIWQPTLAVDVAVSLISIAVTVTVLYTDIINRIDYDRYFSKDGIEIVPIQFASGQVKFFAGSNGLLVEGDNYRSAFDWRRVEDIKLDNGEELRSLFEYILDEISSTASEDETSQQDLLKAADPQKFRMLIEKWKSDIRTHVAGEKFKVIRVVLKGRGRKDDSDKNEEKTGKFDKVYRADISEEIIIPTRLFYPQEGVDWFSFYVDINRYRFMREYGYKFARV